MQVQNEWKFLTFYSPSLYSQIGWEHDRTGSIVGNATLFPPSLQLISLTGHPV